MKTTTYTRFPTKNAWEKDSWINDFRVTRKSDPVLKRIDNLLGNVSLASDGAEKKYLECELYFATNYWLNNYLAVTNMRKERAPAVRMLRQFVETDLARSLKCHPQMLRPRLQKHFAKSINSHGVWCDRSLSPLTIARRDKYRISFDCGKAYWLEWWKNKSVEATTLELVNTMKANKGTSGNKKGDMTDDDWGYFVMSFDRELYIGGHMTTPNSDKWAVFHSSYLGGMPVQFAGSIRIIDGIVKGVRNNSGHYKPGDSFFINILEQLKTVGVPLKEVELRNFKDDPIEDKDGNIYPADKYLQDNGCWEKVLERKKEYLLDQAALRTAMGRKRIYKLIYPTKDHSQQPESTTKQNLSKLVAEQYNLLLDKGQSPGPALWRQTWKGVCDAIWQFMPANDPGVSTFRSAWQRRALNSGPPPRPRKGPR